MKPGEKISEHGITAERLPDRDIRYSVNIMVDGKRIHRVIGRESEGVTRTQCEEFIAGKQTDARAGRLSLPKGRKLALTFATAARIMHSGSIRRRQHIPVKRRHLRLYLVPYFGALRLDAITGFTVDTYRKRRLDQGAGNGTVNRELATLLHLFYRAVDLRWLHRLPSGEELKESAGRIIALSDAQQDALLRAAIAGADADCWLFVAFGFNTTMRHAEIIAARRDRLDLANRPFTSRTPRPASASSRSPSNSPRSSPINARCATSGEAGYFRYRMRIAPPATATAGIARSATR